MLSSPGIKEQMDRKAASQRVCSPACAGIWERPSPALHLRCAPIHELNRGKTLILVLLLSLGLWALLWAGVSLLGVYGQSLDTSSRAVSWPLEQADNRRPSESR